MAGSKYERDLKRQYICRYIIVGILLVMLNILYVVNVVRKIDWQQISIGWALVDLGFVCVTIIVSVIGFLIFFACSDEQRAEKVDEYESKLKLDEKKEELLYYLRKKRLEIKLKLELELASDEFIDTVKNPKIKWYVKRQGISLRLIAYEGSKKVFDDIVNYEFLDLYFILDFYIL